VSGGGFPSLNERLATTFDGHLAGAHTFGRFKLSGDADVWYQAGDSVAIEHDALEAETLSQKLREPLEPVGHTHDERFLLNLGLGGELEVGSQSRLGFSARMLSEDRSALMGLFDTMGEDSRLKWQVLLADASYEHEVSDQLRLRGRLPGARRPQQDQPHRPRPPGCVPRPPRRAFLMSPSYWWAKR